MSMVFLGIRANTDDRDNEKKVDQEGLEGIQLATHNKGLWSQVGVEFWFEFGWRGKTLVLTVQEQAASHQASRAQSHTSDLNATKADGKSALSISL
eukprot:1346235-Amorphochlora_amoeboformis.AAC.1